MAAGYLAPNVDRLRPCSRGPQTGNVRPMDLEEKTLEQVGDRCEECGAKLTERELEQVLESGGPALCTVHAQEEVAVSDEDAPKKRSSAAAGDGGTQYSMAPRDPAVVQVVDARRSAGRPRAPR